MGIETWLPALLGQLVRHLLTLAATLLTAYGVTADQATAIVGPATAIVVSLIMFLLTQVWGLKAAEAKLNATPPRK